MVGAKKKAKSEVRKKVKAAPDASGTPRSVPDASDGVLAVWKEEVEALRQAKPKSLDEAVQIIVERTIKRLNLSESEAEDTARFIEEVLSNDPIVRKHLRDALNLTDA